MTRSSHPNKKNARTPQGVHADYYGLNRKHHRKDHWRDEAKVNFNVRARRWNDKSEIGYDYLRPMAAVRNTENLLLPEGLSEYYGEDTDAYDFLVAQRAQENQDGLEAVVDKEDDEDKDDWMDPDPVFGPPVRMSETLWEQDLV